MAKGILTWRQVIAKLNGYRKKGYPRAENIDFAMTLAIVFQQCKRPKPSGISLGNKHEIYINWWDSRMNYWEVMVDGPNHATYIYEPIENSMGKWKFPKSKKKKKKRKQIAPN